MHDNRSPPAVLGALQCVTADRHESTLLSQPLREGIVVVHSAPVSDQLTRIIVPLVRLPVSKFHNSLAEERLRQEFAWAKAVCSMLVVVFRACAAALFSGGRHPAVHIGADHVRLAWGDACTVIASATFDFSHGNSDDAIGECLLCGCPCLIFSGCCCCS